MQLFEFMSKRMKRMLKWCNENPHRIYADYRDEISQKIANDIVMGDFDSLWGWVWEIEIESDVTYWQNEFANEFGYDDFDAMPERIQEIARENMTTDSRDFVRTCCNNTRVKINARLHKNNGELIYTAGNYPDDYEIARYVKRAFGVEGKPWEIARKIECVYGGEGMESAVIIGTLDLWQIIESGKVPTHIVVGPDDSDNLLFYEYMNGAGNCGSVKIGKTRKFKASFHVDGMLGYGIDDCYGFVGSVWNHELKTVS